MNFNSLLTEPNYKKSVARNVSTIIFFMSLIRFFLYGVEKPLIKSAEKLRGSCFFIGSLGAQNKRALAKIPALPAVPGEPCLSVRSGGRYFCDLLRIKD